MELDSRENPHLFYTSSFALKKCGKSRENLKNEGKDLQYVAKFIVFSSNSSMEDRILIVIKTILKLFSFLLGLSQVCSRLPKLEPTI